MGERVEEGREGGSLNTLDHRQDICRDDVSRPGFSVLAGSCFGGKRHTGAHTFGNLSPPGLQSACSLIAPSSHPLLLLAPSQVICRLKGMQSAPEARALALDVRRMCAAIRASLETHVRR